MDRIVPMIVEFWWWTSKKPTGLDDRDIRSAHGGFESRLMFLDPWTWPVPRKEERVELHNRGEFEVDLVEWFVVGNGRPLVKVWVR